MHNTATAPLGTLLESIDVVVTQTTRVTLRRGRRTVTPAGATTLLYVVHGALGGDSATSCVTDPRSTGGIVARGHVSEFPAGAALFTMGAVPLEFEAQTDAELVVITVELNETAHRLRRLLPDPLTITDFSRLDPALASLASNMGAKGSPEPVVAAGGGEVVCRLMARTLLVGVLRAWVSAGCAPSGWAARVADPYLDPVLAAIHRDPGQDWSLDTLASLGAMSRSAFARRFREVLGSSPGQYITGVRMEDAKRRLSHGATVTQTSRELGYSSDEGFSRAFRRHTGVSPSRWE